MNLLSKIAIGAGLLFLISKLAGKKIWALNTVTLQDEATEKTSYASTTTYQPGELVGKIVKELPIYSNLKKHFWIESSKNKNIFHDMGMFENDLNYTLKRPKIGGIGKLKHYIVRTERIKNTGNRAFEVYVNAQNKKEAAELALKKVGKGSRVTRIYIDY